MSGLKISLPGYDARTASPEFLSVDSDFPLLKCDLRKNPKNYGTLNITVASLPVGSGSAIQIYKQSHGYSYIPTFLTAWEYPPGTDPLSNLNTTFGIGDLDASIGQNFYISMYCDSQNFYITGYTLSGSPVTNTSFTVRFYIFADDFMGI